MEYDKVWGGRDGVSQMAAVVNIFVTGQTAHHTQAGQGQFY